MAHTGGRCEQRGTELAWSPSSTRANTLPPSSGISKHSGHMKTALQETDHVRNSSSGSGVTMLDPGCLLQKHFCVLALQTLAIT